MDFLEFNEAWQSLSPLKVIRLETSTDDAFRPGLEDSDDLVILDIRGTTPDADAIPLEIPADRAADALEAMVHKLTLKTEGTLDLAMHIDITLTLTLTTALGSR